VPTSAETRTILVVDDDEGLLVLMAETLRAEGYEVATAGSARTARAALESAPPDLLILDLKLADGHGPDLVRGLQAGREPVPFVVVTGQGDEKVAVEVMKQGALDYVMKDTGLFDLLPAVVKRALTTVGQARDLAAAQKEHRRLESEILAVGERERHSIGADLHDNLGQQLTALELMCTLAKEDAAPYPALAKRLDVMGKLMREAIAQTRALARGLVPVGDAPDALQNGLTELVERTAQVGTTRCTLECPVPVLLENPPAAGHLYRIAQEAVNNALKHAHARHITVRLAATAAELTLEIEDDGSGISTVRGPRRRSLGLGVMQHRADVIGATLTVDSRRGEGVTVRCVLPLKR
jgi:signal transduction histidine kinase